MFTKDQLEDAHTLVRQTMPPTLGYAWPLLSEAIGCEVWLKHENHTPIGAFKIRGGLVYMNDAAKSHKQSNHSGFITATRGNHGQSLPFAARQYGMKVTVLAPLSNSEEKNAAMRALGADLILKGDDFAEACSYLAPLSAERGLTLVPAFHPLLVRGVATYALELMTTAPDLDQIYVPIGMGSGIAGLIRTRDLLGLKTKIIGVVAERAPAYALSFEAKKRITTQDAKTFADGVACSAPDPDALDIIYAGAEHIVRVSDDEIAGAMRLIYQSCHNIAEGAGAVALAAIKKEQAKLAGKKVGAILTGGNIDMPLFQQVLSGQTPSL